MNIRTSVTLLLAGGCRLEPLPSRHQLKGWSLHW